MTTDENTIRCDICGLQVVRDAYGLDHDQPLEDFGIQQHEAHAAGVDAFDRFAQADLEAKGVDAKTAAQVVADTYGQAGSVQLTALIILAAILPLLASVAYFTAAALGTLTVV